MVEIPLQLLPHQSDKPRYKTAGASGVDLYAAHEAIIEPGKCVSVGTGYKMAIPEGYDGAIRPRSGIANDYVVTVLNSPGTIDSDYRGEIRVLVINHSDMPFRINPGDRIAQMVFMKVERVQFKIVDNLPKSVRGEGGFGHTNLRD